MAGPFAGIERFAYAKRERQALRILTSGGKRTKMWLAFGVGVGAMVIDAAAMIHGDGSLGGGGGLSMAGTLFLVLGVWKWQEMVLLRVLERFVEAHGGARPAQNPGGSAVPGAASGG